MAHGIALITINDIAAFWDHLETCLFVWPLLQILTYAEPPATFYSA